MAILIGGTTIIDNSRNLTNVASIFSCTGVASQAEAEAGTSNTVLMTPLRVAQAISALGGQVINRIQRGSTSVVGGYTPSVSIFITSVNTAKSFISQGQKMNQAGAVGSPGGSGSSFYRAYSTASASARLFSSTVVSVDLGSSNGASGIVDWEVIEFK